MSFTGGLYYQGQTVSFREGATWFSKIQIPEMRQKWPEETQGKSVLLVSSPSAPVDTEDRFVG